VLLGEQGADQADDRGAVGEDADDVGAAADLLVQPLERVVRPELAPVLLRKLVNARISGPASSSSAAASGKRPSSWATILACCSRTDSASGWAKIERTIVATKLCALLGTRVSRLRMKCMRQRCQLAPGGVAAIATRPGWASEVTRRTPARPRATRAAQEGELGGAVLRGDEIEPCFQAAWTAVLVNLHPIGPRSRPARHEQPPKKQSRAAAKPQPEGAPAKHRLPPRTPSAAF
jgi:hypothetical protein